MAVNGEASLCGERRRVGDMRLDRAPPLEEPALHFALQLAQLHHAASSAWPAAMARAISSSATNSARGGILSSRSIIVGTGPKMRERLAIEAPHRRGDRVIVRVDQVIAHIAMSGQMELAHAFLRDSAQ